MCVCQDVPYSVEAVVQAGGYVVHQVTAAGRLKTGDRVQLHLDQVDPNTPQVLSEPGPVWLLSPDLLPANGGPGVSGPQAVLHGEAHRNAHPELRSAGGSGPSGPAERISCVS